MSKKYFRCKSVGCTEYMHEDIFEQSHAMGIEMSEATVCNVAIEEFEITEYTTKLTCPMCIEIIKFYKKL